MSWKFVPNDDFDVAQLKIWQEFFENDLKSARAYLREVQNFERRMKLPDNNGWAEKIAMEDVKISKENLGKVNRAIDIAEGRAEKWETKFHISDTATKQSKPALKRHWWN